MPAENNILKNNFILRGESYKKGMLLLVDYLTPQEWKLGTIFPARLTLIKTEIEGLYKKYSNNLSGVSSFEEGNKHLQHLLSSFDRLLAYHTNLSTFQSLMEAERYFVWLTGRKDLVTEIPFPAIEEENLEIKLIESPNIDQELLSEYSQAEHTTWFNLLSGWQKTCIAKEKERLCVSSIPSSLRSIPSLANSAYHTCQINNELSLSFFRSATQLPIDLLGNKNTVEEQFRLTCVNLASQIRVSIASKANALGSIPELVIFTQSILSPGLIASIKAKFLTDASDNDTQIYNSKEKAVKLFQYALDNPDALIQDAKIKSIFFTSEEQQKDVYYKDLLEKFGLIAQKNKTYKYRENKPVKLTLLSTNHPYNILRHFGTYTPQTVNNEFNTALLMGAIARYLTPLLLKTIKQSESGWQPERWTQLEEDLKFSCFSAKLNKLINELNCCEKSPNLSDNSRKSLAETLENFVSFVKEQDVTKDVKNKFLEQVDLQLLDALQTLLSIPSGQGVLSIDKRHKQQLKSIAEIIIIDRMGGAAWVACKSGKDRTGGAANAFDAAAICYAQHKKFPRFNDNGANRKLYLETFKTCHESGHQQKAASQNAPGAQGLVKLSNFIPSDLALDVKNIRLETQLARLNKPKNIKISPEEPFKQQILKNELLSLEDKTITVTNGQSVALYDWSRNWEIYFINGKSVKELRNGEEFKDENDLSEFIETHLLVQIKDQEAKKYYLALALGFFHQGGFLHVFSLVSMALINDCYAQHEQNAIIGQPDMRINLSWGEGKGIQIEEINVYKEKTHFDWEDPSEKGDFCETHSCIFLNLNPIKDKGYKLAINIQSAYVNCTDTLLKSVFFSKRTNLLEAFIHFLQSLLVAIKRYFDKLVKPDPVLDESWISKTNATFFKPTKTIVNEASNALPDEPSVSTIPPKQI